MEYLLETREVSKSFSGRLAVDRVSIKMRKGDIYGFIGENGAGKTTLMRMVCGLAAPTAGEIIMFGSRDLVSQRRKMGCTIEIPALYPNMTASDNMEAQRLLLGIKDRTVCSRLLDMVGLNYTGRKKSKDFSMGMKQRLVIALALLGDPEFLVLDEPTNGLDPMGIKEVRDLFQRLNTERGISILVSSHHLGELEKIATCYGVIHAGRLVDEFRAEDLKARCGKNLLIHTDDPQKTVEVLSQMFEGAQFERTPENAVRLKGHAEEAGRVNARLIQEGVSVNALAPEGENLEDYFLRLMGGKKYA
ncbi:MAG: ATP-binding cassette domain-containing protein [Clostridiales bacterium]|nr:ATP-binding cassette domain-containing protein [Clostridiales bacterium]